MRGVWVLGPVLGLVLGLAACQATAPADPAPLPAPATELPESAPQDAATEPQPETPVQPPVEAAPQPATIDLPAPPPDPPALALQRAACRDRGGQLSTRAPGIYACVMPTGDAGRACDEASDCEGLCLARSGTCAPITPIYGCQEVFTARGHRETLCTR